MDAKLDDSTIDMGDFDEEPGYDSHEKRSNDSENPSSYDSPMYDAVRGQVANAMWESGKQQAAKAWSFYGNVDILRPYFDVEPSDVAYRLINSLHPKVPRPENPVKVPRELYGPSVLVLTLVAILLFEMKLGGHTVQEGTLMGSAFATCFGYWWGLSGCLWLAGFLSNTHLTFVQFLNLIGYSMFSHCVVILLGILIHTTHDHVFFYTLLCLFGGLSGLRMVSVIFSRTHAPSQKLFLSMIALACHVLFFIYLHFAYHTIVEGIAEVFTPGESIDNRPVVPPINSVAGQVVSKV